MRNIHLVPSVTDPGNRGPTMGMFALQRLLWERHMPWLSIGGNIPNDAIPWFWHCLHGTVAASYNAMCMPFITGPNMLFHNSRTPCCMPYERTILDSPYCPLLFTDGTWYVDLIRQHQGKPSSAKIVSVPYPIGDKPLGPLPKEYDVLVYVKSGVGESVVREICQAISSHVVFRYGSYDRAEMIKAARQSACCIYLSDDDRGPIALAEIMLSGCPAVGFWRGAPWVVSGETGVLVDELVPHKIIAAAIECKQIDRGSVREKALAMFDDTMITDKVIAALESVRSQS